MRKEEAIAKYETGWWKEATLEEILDFQLYEPRLCMPLDDYHEAVEKGLCRPVFNIELKDLDRLQREYEGVKAGAPTQ